MGKLIPGMGIFFQRTSPLDTYYHTSFCLIPAVWCDMAVVNFDHESWAPPDKELRKLRKDFYGPLTDEFLRLRLEGEAEEDAKDSAAKAAMLAKTTPARAKTFPGLKGSLTSTGKIDPAVEKWFVTWQDRG